MCGIVGLFNLDGKPAHQDQVKKMASLIAHRGPDDHGFWSHQSCALGHQRLSIIDLSKNGRNPMSNEDGTLWIVFNGEIYNYLDLKKDLIQKGHHFKSQTDTEVIVHLYQEYGTDFIAQLNGMFAFAIFDTRQNLLLLARDRFGVKPLYYTQINQTLAFASEIKAFLALSEFKVQMDPVSFFEHFTFQNTLEDRTFFRNVQFLPAGHFLICHRGKIKQTQYWDLSFGVPHNFTQEKCVDGLVERFEQAVKSQLMSDVPLGMYLSGGMDTGSISAVASRILNKPHTFTCGFDLPPHSSEQEKYFDERRESWDLAKLLDTQHHELTLDSDSLPKVMSRVVWHLDEPRVGISYQVYYTAEMIRKYVTVVLSGVGGDELFAGYPWRYAGLTELKDVEQIDQALYKKQIRFFNDDEKRKLFGSDMNRATKNLSTFDNYSNVLKKCNSQDPLNRALYSDFKIFMNGLLMVDDKLSMAHSVEARVPFLDNALVDYAAQIPPAWKYQNGEGKQILRQAMKKVLPSDIVNRRKQGFTPPDETWYKGPLLAYVTELLLSAKALERGLFEPKAVENIIHEHVSGKKNHRFLLWSLMCLEWWNRLFVDREHV